MNQSREGHTSSREIAWRMGRRIAARVAEQRSVVAVHRATPKNAEFALKGELRKTEEEKARLRAAASRVGDTLTGRALKRVRFAEDQDDNNAEVPEPTCESAPSNLPAGAASSSSAPTPSVNPALTCVCK